METGGPAFVSKSGYLLLIWEKVCLKKLAFSNKKSTKRSNNELFLHNSKNFWCKISVFPKIMTTSTDWLYKYIHPNFFTTTIISI